MATVQDDGFVGGVGFGRGLIAAREVRERVRTHEDGAGGVGTFAVCAMAGDAAGVIDDLAPSGVGRCGIVHEFLSANGREEREERDAEGRERQERARL